MIAASLALGRRGRGGRGRRRGRAPQCRERRARAWSSPCAVSGAAASDGSAPPAPAMMATLGLSKVFILDKYFTELQKFWETEKKLQGEVQPPRRRPRPDCDDYYFLCRVRCSKAPHRARVCLCVFNGVFVSSRRRSGSCGGPSAPAGGSIVFCLGMSEERAP